MASRDSKSTPAETEAFPGQVTDAELDAAVTDGKPAGKNARAYDEVELRGIVSFDDAKALAERIMGPLDDAAEVIGNGFTVLPTAQKDRICNVPFVILSVDFSAGKHGDFCSAMIVTKSGEKLILNDGSVGIRAQLDEWCALSGKTGGLYVSGGLRSSTYPIKDENGNYILDNDGKPQESTTYYLNV